MSGNNGGNNTVDGDNSSSNNISDRKPYSTYYVPGTILSALYKLGQMTPLPQKEIMGRIKPYSITYVDPVAETG